MCKLYMGKDRCIVGKRKKTVNNVIIMWIGELGQS